MNRYINIYILLFFSSLTFAQLTLSNGNHVLEITGSTSTYFNNRNLKPGENDFKKDRFRLRDAQLQLEGRVGNTWEYELQVDFVDLASANAGIIDPENPGLMEAMVNYKGLGFIEIQAGYGKINYSRSSMVPFLFTPYWQRAQVARDFFSRRDVGLTLKSDFWNQRVNVYAGVYTGLGENSLQGDNDPSGQLEYAGRVDIAYPSRFRYRDIDDKISPVPMVAVGVNGRYSNKTLAEGRTFPEFSQGEYGMRVINGEKMLYGFDVAVQYMGFSAQFELHQLRGKPLLETDPLFQGYNLQQTNGYFKAGGYYTQLNYFSPKLKTIVSIRYEEMDWSDLVPGKSKRISPAIAYQINGFNAMIKAQYFGIIQEDPLDTLKWEEQFRIGIQFAFK
jgi:hypothetical protein